jgi:homocitrate synthase NifV
MSKIKISDRTLSCMDGYAPTKAQLKELITLLFHCDADVLELTPKMLSLLGELPPFGSYVLRIDEPSEADKYPMIDQFVCKRFSDEARHVYAEISLNDVGDTNLLLRHQHDRMLRISGLDDLLRSDVGRSLDLLKGFLPKNAEFRPGNSLHCGVALAVEWLDGKCGNTIVTSFRGLDGGAPFEEVLIALRHLFRRHPQTDYESLPRINEIICEITGMKTDTNKPVIGEGIFTVESGIHIGGILKHPKCYELYPPESVGRKRIFVYGKYSGRGSIRHKLVEMGIKPSEIELADITQNVKALAAQMNRSITEEELLIISGEAKNGGGQS